MDILNPLETSGEEEIETKVILNQDLNIVDEQGMESDEDQKATDPLSPQTLLESPTDTEVYSFRSPEGTITYRVPVLQVEEGSENVVPQLVSTSSNFPGSGVQQVLTSSLNGQLYIIGNSNEVFNNQGGNRAIAPRASLIETTTTVAATIKKKDERRRATHNEVERRRRDKINSWITKLSKIIPENNSSEMKGNGHYEGQSKGGILAKACEYICELKDDNQKLDLYAKENKQLRQNVEILKQQNVALERENRTLHEMLKQSGVELPNEFNS